MIAVETWLLRYSLPLAVALLLCNVFSPGGCLFGLLGMFALGWGLGTTAIARRLAHYARACEQEVREVNRVNRTIAARARGERVP